MQDGILGVYANFGYDAYEQSGDVNKRREEQARIFREFLWGADAKGGLSLKFKELKKGNYGKDLDLILFQFRVNPISSSLGVYKPIGNYRPKEKSFEVWITVNDDNFFSKNGKERNKFIKNTILDRLNDIACRLKRSRLDIDIDKLIVDVNDVL